MIAAPTKGDGNGVQEVQCGEAVGGEGRRGGAEGGSRW
nr:MAG TPA: hypothetical protein [Caudoviricetes sp.]